MFKSSQVLKKIDSVEKRLLSVITVILILLPIIAGLVYLLVFAVNVPYLDQWDSDISLSITFHSGEGTALDVLRSHNDLRPIIPNILLPLLHDMTNFNMLIAILLSYVIYVASFFILSALIIT